MNHVLSQIGLRVPDIDAMVEHATAILGVAQVDADGDVVRLALPGPAVCLVLIASEVAALDHIALRTEERNLAEIAERARSHELQIHESRELGGEGIRLYAPNRLAVEIGAGAVPVRSPGDRDVGPVIGSLDHVSLTAVDLAGTVAFFCDVLGFRVSDSVADQRHWLRCGANHHTVAVFAGGDALQHYAFKTPNIGQLQRLGDLLATRGQNFLWGPGRHGLGANVFSYHLDPAGTILEVCCDMIQVPDEEAWVARIWPAEGLASAVMWGPPPPAGFREVAVPIFDHAAVRR